MEVLRPPMGFNTWNTFGAEINESVIKENADAMVDKGLLDAGYEYLVIDDCWSKKKRDKETGKIVPAPDKFPNGMNAVSDYVHSKGLKFGMYSCAGTRTCADYPGSYDHEFLDAETFAEYGADYLKYDFCYKPHKADGAQLYRKMGMALRACGRDIVYSACNWGNDEVEKWIRSAGAHLYRSTGDINDQFESYRDIAVSQFEKLAYSGNGCFNDPDMLTVDMHGQGNVANGGCTDIEYKTEFALWCMYSAPLMLGCDVRKISDSALKLVTNKTLIRINQDIEARPPFSDRQEGLKANDRTTIFKLLSDNQIAVMCVNFADGERTASVMMDNCGIPASSGYGLHMVDAFTGEDLGVQKEFFEVRLQAHDSAVYLCDIAK